MLRRDRYNNFAHLAAHEKEGIDYTITVVRRPSSTIAVIAPHGGKIEVRTADIARAIAGDEFNLYLFEGIKTSDNYATLHITSHRFDEPSCLALIRECSFVVAIHGCTGNDERILLGGLDVELKAHIAEALWQARLRVETDSHTFGAADQNNICNQGQTGKGVQIELSRPLRGSRNEANFIQAVRAVLLSYHATT
jgi:phage replication-related protein YjqB (UPF0714/DUF867 family)